jgi:hypothetical protein
MLGFGVLAFSGFAVTHQMGLLSVMIIGLAIVADLVMLPPLLILFDNEGEWQGRQLRTRPVFRLGWVALSLRQMPKKLD